MKYIEVVAAVFQNQEGKIYCARRRDDGELALKWEFPGGKIEDGESHRDALIREIKEELSAVISVGDYIMTVKHQYKSFHLTMHAYYATVLKGQLILSEHTGFNWLDKSELMTLDWAAADIPIVEKLMND